MAGPGHEPDHYAAERLRDALAGDERVSELGLQVRIVAGKVFLTGQVPTQDRVDAASAITALVLPELELHNDLSVTELTDTPRVEHIR